MKQISMQNGDIVDVDDEAHCDECGLPVGPRASVRDERLFCSTDCATDYLERRALE
jgi:endogenous inhibitor of DNA gyrase (YacG/DUF329 family)